MASARINTHIPEDLASDLREYADQIGISITAALILILRQHLGGSAGGKQLSLPVANPDGGKRGK